MASQELSQPLLGQPQPKPSHTPTIIDITIHAVIVVITLFILMDDPSCDQPLVLWAECVAGISIAGVMLGLLKIVRGKNVLYGSVLVSMFAVSVVVWVWGHWPVYESETCAEGLWYLAFVFTLLGDVIACLVVMGLLAGMIWGFPCITTREKQS